jgi:hypothetical protein
LTGDRLPKTSSAPTSASRVRFIVVLLCEWWGASVLQNNQGGF